MRIITRRQCAAAGRARGLGAPRARLAVRRLLLGSRRLLRARGASDQAGTRGAGSPPPRRQSARPCGRAGGAQGRASEDEAHVTVARLAGGGGSGRGVHGASQRALRVRCPTRCSPRPNAALCACARFAQEPAPRRPSRDAGLTRRCWLATFLCVRGPHDPTSPPRLPGRGRRALAEERDLAGRRS